MKPGISPSQMLVVHPHLHARRTGVTAHTEAIVEALSRTGEDDVRALGQVVKTTTAPITLGEVWRRAATESVVWHAHRNNELLLGWLLKLLRRHVGLVFTRHGGARPGWFSRWLMPLADALVTLNPQLAGWMPQGTTVVPHGISLPRFSPPPDRGEAWRVLGLPGARGIGVIGRVRPAKGQADFAQALATVFERLPALRAELTPVLVGLVKRGDAAFADGIRATLPTAQWVGEQADIARWYRGFDVVVQPSHVESFSLVIPEAMACGCVVVCGALPATGWLVEDGRTGFLYPPGDAAALADVLTRVLADPALMARVSRAAAEEARARFGVEREARELRALYASVEVKP